MEQELADLRTHIEFAQCKKWNGNVVAVVGGGILGMFVMGAASSPPALSAPVVAAALTGLGLLYWVSTGLYFLSSWDPQWRWNAQQLRRGVGAEYGCLWYLLKGVLTAQFMPFVGLSMFRWGTLRECFGRFLEWGTLRESGTLREGVLSWWKAQSRMFRLLLVVFGVLLLLDLAGRPFRSGSGSAIPQTVSGGNTATGLEGGTHGGTATEDSSSAVEDSLELSESARRRIQRGLAIAGFDPGPVDGVFGKSHAGSHSAMAEPGGCVPDGVSDRDRCGAVAGAGARSRGVSRGWRLCDR